MGANKAKGVDGAWEEEVSAHVELCDQSLASHWIASRVAGGALELEIFSTFMHFGTRNGCGF